MEQAAPSAGRPANNALVEHRLKLTLGGSQTRRVKPPEFGGSWLAGCLDDVLHTVWGGGGRGGGFLKKHLRKLALKCRQPISGVGGETGGRGGGRQPAPPANHPQETAAAAGEGEGGEEPPAEKRTPARAGDEAPNGERTASAYDRPGVTAPITGGDLAVAGGTEDPEGAFTSVDP